MSYSYDAAGRRLTRSTPAGAKAEYGYDPAGRLVSLHTSGRTISFTRDASGRETERCVGDSLTLAQTWSAANRLTAQTLSTADGLIQQRSYDFRRDGLLLGVDDPLQGRIGFGLDDAGRVTEVHARDWTETYAYDSAGHQTHATWPEHHSGHEAHGERSYTGTSLTHAGGMHYEYDQAGRIVVRRKTRLSRKPDIWHYTWDAEDRLTSVTTPDGTVWRYSYDPFGRRTAKQRMAADGVTVVEETRFVWDGYHLAEQTTIAQNMPSMVTLTWDHDGLRPVSQSERLTDAATQEEIDSRFFAIATDLVGTPTELVDTADVIAWRSRKTLWGITAWNHDSTAYTPLRFPGQYYDRETGLHYNLHRYYDAEIGRYLSLDPLGLTPSPNPSSYVHNPHTAVDPLGLAPYGTINPSLVRFSQDSVGARFKNGLTIEHVAAGLRSGWIKVDDMPPIRLVVKDGNLFTLDNRRLVAFQKADIPIPFKMATADEAANEAWKFTTVTEGRSILIRETEEIWTP